MYSIMILHYYPLYKRYSIWFIVLSFRRLLFHTDSKDIKDGYAALRLHTVSITA
jgi:hypothetical protein